MLASGAAVQDKGPWDGPHPGVLSPALLWGFRLSPMPVLAPLNSTSFLGGHPCKQLSQPRGFTGSTPPPRKPPPGALPARLAQASGAAETEVSEGMGVQGRLCGAGAVGRAEGEGSSGPGRG